MATEVNEVDSAHLHRSVEVLKSEILNQLGNSVSDYAVWDEAAKAFYGPIDRSFAESNLKASSATGILFDAAVVFDETGQLQIGYRNGSDITPNQPFIDPKDVLALIALQTRQPDEAATAFVDSTTGPVLAALRTVLTNSGEAPEGVKPRYLLVTQTLKQQRLAALAALFGVEQLSLVNGESSSKGNSIDIVSPSGQTIGALAWTKADPGSLAFNRAKEPLYVVLGLLMLVIGFLVLTIWKILAAMQRGEDDARRDANHDPLSGLPNRASFNKALESMAQKSGLSILTVMFVDLDGFKEVNDTFGHEVGDRLIKTVAAGFHCLVNGKGILARLGGDEFALALLGQDSLSEATELGTRMIEFLAEPFDFEGRMVKVGSSIGVASTYDGPLSNIELIRQADVAMYAAKAAGKNRVTLYDANMDADRKHRAELELALREALDRNELQVHFQPTLRASDNRIVAVEALLRWIRPGVGPVSPAIFLPVAEEAGMTDALGTWVLRRALREGKAFGDCRIAVNIFSAQFRNPLFNDQLAALLKEEDFPANRLELDINESYLVAYPERAQRVISMLHDLGVHVALDDFGTGFSSIGYLRRFAFDRVKIDRSVVIDVATDPASQQFVESTVALADTLGVEVTAEGIERPDEAQALRKAGCHELQGFHFGPPTVSEEILRRLKQQDARLARQPADDRKLAVGG
ncbi:bifunctional diguanylate cyclase/phosphodiesterase [Oryzibacter oryziterrae]|uniref:bifunctional diguanylate cyclase/phosphodiesterase n=1 Tax=Oryzibacter oryziterrae TaxID=2766474 RepID=UPI001F260A84|nr:EAL domain-containing protein [Oryzibacter oryziterrae]